MDRIPDEYIEESVAECNDVSICFILYRCIDECEEGRLLPEEGRLLPEEGRLLPEEGRLLPEEGRLLPEEGRLLPDE